LSAEEPPALRYAAHRPLAQTGQVKGVGCGYWRMVSSVEALIVRAEAARHRWMKSLPPT